MSRPSKQGRKTAQPPRQPAGFEARAGALRHLHAVLEQGRQLEESSARGTPADRAEAKGLADLTLRRLNQIDDALARFVDRPPKGDGLHILRLMAAELLFNGTASHAGVDMAVRLAKANRATARLSGLINAVGRRLADQGPGIVEAQDAAKMALPDWLERRLIEDWGQEATSAIAEVHLTPAPHDLTLHNPADAEAMVPELGAKILPTGSVRLNRRPQISALPGYAQGAWWVQDAAAALPAKMLRAEPGMRVLDLCAAPGGKTLQLAAEEAHVTALDISDRRMERVSENLERTGMDAELVTADALEWQSEAPFDAILLDAPCSATGTIRRHPDLPHRGDRIDLDALHTLQQRLLVRAANWVRPGGTLVYCTCSLFKSEGEAQIDAFLSSTPEFTLDPLTEQDDIPPELVAAPGYLRTR
ncbi:MAG: methyltransferase domain-containing protein, partial [Pseudomonadota bacterium]